MLPENLPQTATPSSLAAVSEPVRASELTKSDAIPVPPDWPFHLRWRPGEWVLEQIDKEWWILPGIQRRVWMPGVCGVHTPRKGESPDAFYRDAMRSDQDRGLVFIDPMRPIPGELLPSGAKEGGYLRSAPARNPLSGIEGRKHHTPWEDVRAPENEGEQATLVTVDQGLWRRYRRWLVESGQLPAPTERDKVKIIEDKRHRLREFQGRAVPDPETKAIGVESRRATLAAAEKAKLPSIAAETKAPKAQKVADGGAGA